MDSESARTLDSARASTTIAGMRATTPPTRAVSLVPLVLAVLGIAIPLVGSNFLVWQLSLLWLLVLAGVVLAVHRANPPRTTRVFCGLAALPVLFLLGWEGGWWPIPAVVAEILLDAWAARAGGVPIAGAMTLRDAD